MTLYWDEKRFESHKLRTRFCDVTLDWDDKRFKSHKLILSTGADYWNSTNPRNDNHQNFRFQVF